MTSYNIKTDFLSDEEAGRLAKLYPELAVDVGPYDYCPTCRKTGTYRWRGQEHQCDCALQLQLHKHYCNSGIGLGYQRLDWDDWVGDPEILKLIRAVYVGQDYVGSGMGLYLWGEMGTGKTMLATLVLKEMVKRGLRCYSITIDGLIDEFTKGWASDEDKRWYEHKIKFSDVLLLDDLGKEGNRGSLPQSTFNNLLRARVQGGRPTLITSNIEPDKLGRIYGGSSLELLYESSMDEHFTGTSVRKYVHERNNEEKRNGEKRPIV